MRLTRRAHLLTGLTLGLATAHLTGALAVQSPTVRAALALFVSAGVLMVWGVRSCLAEYRQEHAGD